MYAATSQNCGGAPNGIWAIDLAGENKAVMSWTTNGGGIVGAMAFTGDGTLIAAIGPGKVSAGGYTNAIVAFDPKTLHVKDWFTSPTVDSPRRAAPLALPARRQHVAADARQPRCTTRRRSVAPITAMPRVCARSRPRDLCPRPWRRQEMLPAPTCPLRRRSASRGVSARQALVAGSVEGRLPAEGMCRPQLARSRTARRRAPSLS
jgi:hypothetical protein